jgi:hypothetical protein
MILHEDKDAFEELIAATAQSVGLPEIYVEKDYWVSRALKALSLSSHSSDVVFKGGTSLSKAYRIIDRFSEDIDLAVFSKNLSVGQRKNLLKNVEHDVAQELLPLPKDPRISKGSSFRKTVYQYPRHIGEDDFGQASPELLIEINAFTHPEPFEQRELRTLIADMLDSRGEHQLIERFELESFSINVLCVERTLVEKILGMVKDSYDEDPVAKLSNRIRHLYDICLILKDERYRYFIKSAEFKSMCAACIEDERSGFLQGNACLEAPLHTAPLFSQFQGWRKSLSNTYDSIFTQLVYGELPPMDDIVASIQLIHEALKNKNI